MMKEVLAVNEAELVRLADSESVNEVILKRGDGASFNARVVLHAPTGAASDNRIMTVTDLSSDFAAARAKECEEQARKSRDEFNRFVYIVSHDLQEPLRAVSNYIGLIEKTLEAQLDDRTRKFMSFAVEGAARLQSMIQDLLRYSRAGTSELSDSGETGLAIASVLSVLKNKIREAGASVTVAKDLPAVLVPEDELRTLFLQVLDNAIKFRDADRPLAVAVTVGFLNADWTRIDVADNGIGIADEHVERVFDVFRCLHRKGKYPGNGMGLAICRRIAESYGGSVEHRSGEADVGGVLSVTLPRK
ncbi:MAG: ATP-binding protein [Verrucomicrobiales bacterium]